MTRIKNAEVGGSVDIWQRLFFEDMKTSDLFRAKNTSQSLYEFAKAFIHVVRRDIGATGEDILFTPENTVQA